MRPFCSLSIALLLSAILSGCGDASADDPLAALESELDRDTGAPVIAAAMADPIMVDPALNARANANAVRPPSRPYAAPIPMSDVAARDSTAELIAREKPDAAPPAQGKGCPDCAIARDATTLAMLAQPMGGQCAAGVSYSQGWATRMSAGVPLLPNVRMMEAAGVENAACDLRIVRFWSDLAPGALLDWYSTQTRRAGYSVERRADDDGQQLAGRHRDGSRYALFVDPRAGNGADVALVVRMTPRTP